jgi:23S rRNA pseudouridine1911/1915/1917 synthase
MPPIQFLIDRRESGRTIAAVLRQRYKLTWARAKRLVENGHIRVAGQLTRAPEQRVKTGNRVWIAPGTIDNPTPAEKKPAAAPVTSPTKAKAVAKAKPGAERANTLAVEVVYADDSVVVVDKPAGLTTVRSKEDVAEFGKRATKFLPTTLADVLPALLGSPNKPVFAVHRLDRDTTGLVVFARTPLAAKVLTKQFRDHTTERRYLALVRGVPTGGRIESVFVQDRGDGRRGSARPGTSPDDGKSAATHVTVIEALGEFAAVECRLETGRTHQVRIHLGESGHPLCGETVYDRPVGGKPLPDGSRAARPMLHAAQLGFTHPEDGSRRDWEAKPPADLAALWHRLRTAQPSPASAPD